MREFEEKDRCATGTYMLVQTVWSCDLCHISLTRRSDVKQRCPAKREDAPFSKHHRCTLGHDVYGVLTYHEAKALLTDAPGLTIKCQYTGCVYHLNGRCDCPGGPTIKFSVAKNEKIRPACSTFKDVRYWNFDRRTRELTQVCCRCGRRPGSPHTLDKLLKTDRRARKTVALCQRCKPIAVKRWLDGYPRWLCLMMGRTTKRDRLEARHECGS